MPKMNMPGCNCCVPPADCCTGTAPTTMTVTISGVTGNAQDSSCAEQVPAIDCGDIWNGSYALTLVSGSFPCRWTLTDFPNLACQGGGFDVTFGCVTTTRYWQLTIQPVVGGGGGWEQKLVVRTLGQPGFFTPWILVGAHTSIFSHSYGSQPTCLAVDMDQTLLLISGQSETCDCSNFTVGTISS